MFTVVVYLGDTDHVNISSLCLSEGFTLRTTQAADSSGLFLPLTSLITGDTEPVNMSTQRLPEVFTVRISEVTLLPEPRQHGPAFSLQTHQSAVLQNVPHQSLLVHNALLHTLIKEEEIK